MAFLIALNSGGKTKLGRFWSERRVRHEATLKKKQLGKRAV